ncbi:MAG: iron-containing alcohol dehydrogenase [Elusimicrobiota bacterium]
MALPLEPGPGFNSTPEGAQSHGPSGAMGGLAFSLARVPEVLLGPGVARRLGPLARRFGKRALVVTGGESLERSGKWASLLGGLREEGVTVSRVSVRGEPSVEAVDAAVAESRGASLSVVIGIGGGSAVDAAKAVAAMLTVEGGVQDYLEGVGTRKHPGTRLPLIAAPTTAGTGSEATKNAVLRKVGQGGFKKSLRHDRFIPDVALLDPELAVGCPPDITAACGMDAFVQLMEAYLSPKCSLPVEALVWSGLVLLKENLPAVCGPGAADARARGAMAYASLMSGIGLANAGLGVVHGLAGPIGGRFRAPHGAVCGILAAPAIEANVRALKAQGERGEPALEKYASLGRLLSDKKRLGREAAFVSLVDTVEGWTRSLGIGSLDRYGIRAEDVDGIVADSDCKDNPVPLGKEELRRIVAGRI